MDRDRDLQLPQKSCRRAGVRYQAGEFVGAESWRYVAGSSPIDFCAVLDRLSPAFRAQHPPSSLSPADASHRLPFKMAAFFKAVNAKIRSNPTVSYICSTRTCLFFLLPRRGQSGRSRLSPTAFLSREFTRRRPPAHHEASVSMRVSASAIAGHTLPPVIPSPRTSQ